MNDTSDEGGTTVSLSLKLHVFQLDGKDGGGLAKNILYDELAYERKMEKKKLYGRSCAA